MKGVFHQVFSIKPKHLRLKKNKGKFNNKNGDSPNEFGNLTKVVELGMDESFLKVQIVWKRQKMHLSYILSIFTLGNITERKYLVLLLVSSFENCSCC